MTTRTAPPPSRPRNRPPVDPRVRERWVAARRAEGRRRLRLLAVAIGVVVLLAAAWGASESALLDVDRIVVKGAERSTPEEVSGAAGVRRGDAMAWLDTGGAAARVEALPWIGDARVERTWPDTVTITVTERSPVAWVDDGGGPAVIDRTGRVLERAPEAPAGVPRIADVEDVPPPGATISPVVGARVAGDLEGLVRSATRSISVQPGGVVLGLVNGVDLRLGGPSAVKAKIRSAFAVLVALDGMSVPYVDVSVPSNPVAGPAASGVE